MDKLDRLAWRAGFSFSAYGLSIGVRANTPEVLTELKSVLTGKWKPKELHKVDRIYSVIYGGGDGRSRRVSDLYSNDFRLARSRDLSRLMSAFDSDYRMFLAEFASRHVFVHAGAVGWKGKGIILPGRSFSGKSTMIAELVRAGAEYYSDEYAVLDARGRLHPFIKPIELRHSVSLKQSNITLAEIGGRAGTKPLPIGMVLLTNFKEGAKWRPRKLTAGRAVLGLLSNTVSARRKPERAIETLERVAARAEILQGFRGNAVEAVPAVLARLDQLIADGAV